MNRLWKKTGYGIGIAVFTMLCFLANPASSETTQSAIVSTVAADYSSGAHSIIDVEPVGGPRNATNELLPTGSDITVSAYGRYFYRIERMDADNVTKFDRANPNTPIWQFSTLAPGENTSSNPQGLLFVNDSKAYLFRYGKTHAWIVNPSATVESEFKIGELDLASYGDQDGIPEMHSGVIAGGKLFITMHRLDRNNEWIPNSTYIAVFDTNTDAEIDTGIPNDDDVIGIPIPIKNPNAIYYLEENDTIYVQGAGKYGATWSGVPPEYSGGIIQLNPDTYEITPLLDDGDDTNHPYGLISGMAVISTTKGYFVSYAGWGDNTLYPFNPTSGEVGEPIEGLIGKNIAGMETGAYADKNGMLWVCNQTDSRIDILNTEDNTLDESVNTSLNPTKVVFVTIDDDEDIAPTGDSGGGGGGCFIASSDRPSGIFGFFWACMGCVLACFGITKMQKANR